MFGVRVANSQATKYKTEIVNEVISLLALVEARICNLIKSKTHNENHYTVSK